MIIFLPQLAIGRLPRLADRPDEVHRKLEIELARYRGVNPLELELVPSH